MARTIPLRIRLLISNSQRAPKDASTVHLHPAVRPSTPAQGLEPPRLAHRASRGPSLRPASKPFSPGILPTPLPPPRPGILPDTLLSHRLPPNPPRVTTTRPAPVVNHADHADLLYFLHLQGTQGSTYVSSPTSSAVRHFFLRPRSGGVVTVTSCYTITLLSC